VLAVTDDGKLVLYMLYMYEYVCVYVCMYIYIYIYNLAPRSWDNSVCIVTGCWLDGREVGVRVPVGTGPGARA
jgi:hypothetical protein